MQTHKIIKYNKGKLGIGLNELSKQDRGYLTSRITEDKYGFWDERITKNGKVFYTLAIKKIKPTKKQEVSKNNLVLELD